MVSPEIYNTYIDNHFSKEQNELHDELRTALRVDKADPVHFVELLPVLPDESGKDYVYDLDVILPVVSRVFREFPDFKNSFGAAFSKKDKEGKIKFGEDIVFANSKDLERAYQDLVGKILEIF